MRGFSKLKEDLEHEATLKLKAKIAREVNQCSVEIVETLNPNKVHMNFYVIHLTFRDERKQVKLS